MYFLTSDRPPPQNTVLKGSEIAHLQPFFDHLSGSIHLRLAADSNAVAVIDHEGHCTCTDYAVQQQCVHTQLASAILRAPEVFQSVRRLPE